VAWWYLDNIRVSLERRRSPGQLERLLGVKQVVTSSSASGFEGASCAAMSTRTCYRTSRSFHFPFWAVCSLSGTQPELPLGRLHPHLEKGILSLFFASSQFNVLRASTRVRRPRALGPQRPKSLTVANATGTTTLVGVPVAWGPVTSECHLHSGAEIGAAARTWTSRSGRTLPHWQAPCQCARGCRRAG
jgi:hypothetical protein